MFPSIAIIQYTISNFYPLIVRDVLVPVVTDAIKTAKIPTINQRVDTPIGHITFELSRFLENLSNSKYLCHKILIGLTFES